jgi:hypothetical protein
MMETRYGKVRGESTAGTNLCWAPVAHACNPSYSGGRDQEDGSLKPAQANSSQDPILKNKKQKQKQKIITTRSWWSSSRFRP